MHSHVIYIDSFIIFTMYVCMYVFMEDILQFLFGAGSEIDAATAAARESILSQLQRHPNLTASTNNNATNNTATTSGNNSLCEDLKRRVSEALGKIKIGNLFMHVCTYVCIHTYWQTVVEPPSVCVVVVR